MKKLIFAAILAATTFMNAAVLPASSENLTLQNSEASILKFVAPPEGGWQYTWTSTCGVTHYTSFPSGWNVMQITQWVSNKNLDECGVRPSRILLADSML